MTKRTGVGLLVLGILLSFFVYFYATSTSPTDISQDDALFLDAGLLDDPLDELLNEGEADIPIDDIETDDPALLNQQSAATVIADSLNTSQVGAVVAAGESGWRDDQEDKTYNKPPYGYAGNVRANGEATGWTYDPDEPKTAISVHAYIDGKAGVGTFIGSTKADKNRSDITEGETSYNHWYSFSIPEEYKDGKTHTLYTYGIDAKGLSAKNNALLKNNPKTFKLVSIATLPPSCTLTASPASITSGQSSTLSWTSTNATTGTIDNGAGNMTPIASGSKSVSPTVSTLYTATVTGAGVGASATCEANVDVTTGGDTTKPTVTLTAPAASSTVSSTVTFRANATDNVGVAGVQFKVDGANVGAEDTTAPYSISWNSTTATNGTHNIRAVARDAAGNTRWSAVRSVTVSNGTADTTKPTVSLTAPAASSTVSSIVTLSANASDNVGVVGVQFKVDGANVGAEDTTAPYSISWNSTTATNGTHNIRAVARDAAGNTRWSAVRSVTVANGTADTTKPTVSLTAPADGATVSGTVTLSASATDAGSGVAKVEFKRGNTVIGEDTTATGTSYSIAWNTTTVANNSYDIRAVARDNAGNVATSTPVVNVMVQNTSACSALSAPAGATIQQGKAVRFVWTDIDESLPEGDTTEADGEEAVLDIADTTTARENLSAPETAAMAPSADKVAVASGPWSATATWGGAVPTANQRVRIPTGRTVTIDVAARAKSVEVNGVLSADPVANGSLTANWVMVMGAGSRFQVGTAAAPFTSSFVLELTGTDTGENVHDAGTKFLMAMDGGEIQMHGKPQVSWTKLVATANKGVAQITLNEPVGWGVGDQIVIAPSSLRVTGSITMALSNPTQAEQRTIVAKSADCRTLTLDQPLAYRHVGVQKSYTNGSKTWILDERAEVGLLSHNVKVQGDVGSEAAGFGAHVMLMGQAQSGMPSGKGYFSNVEFFRVGQKKKLGRYPVHWHLVQDAGAGQYLKDSSIYHSFNRAVTVHASNDLLIERNVAYDHIGHGVFLEDGVEQRNAINYNLVILTKMPPLGEELLPSDNQLYELQNRSPASFWITNPNNTFIGNVAGGTVGTGFWFNFSSTQTGLSLRKNLYPGLRPNTQNLGIFRGNVAHGTMMGFDVHDGVLKDDTVNKNLSWQPQATAYIENFTSYANNLGLYSGAGDKTEKLVFRNVVSADNYDEHLRFANYETVTGSLFVADSGNGIIPTGPKAQVRSLYAIYDGASRLYNSHIVGFDQPGTSFLKNGLAAYKHANHLMSGLTFDPASPPRIAPPPHRDPLVATNGAYWSMSIRDEDGSLTGASNRTIISGNPLLRTSTDNAWPNGNGSVWISQWDFTAFRMSFPGLPRRSKLQPDVTWTRSGGGEPIVSYVDDKYKTDGSYRQAHLIGNGNFTYTVALHSLPSTRRIDAANKDARPGNSVLVGFTKFGRLQGLTLSPAWPRRSSLASLETSGASGYYIDANNTLWLRFVHSTPALMDQVVTIRWTGTGSWTGTGGRMIAQGLCAAGWDRSCPKVLGASTTREDTLIESVQDSISTVLGMIADLLRSLQTAK